MSKNKLKPPEQRSIHLPRKSEGSALRQLRLRPDLVAAQGHAAPQVVADVEDALQACQATPKRSKSQETVDSWYPYHAGFSFEFAHELLTRCALHQNALILDPWNGSGTTTSAATALDLPSVGIDLNPFAATMARAKLAWFLDGNDLRDRALRALKCQRPVPVAAEDPLTSWLARETVVCFRSLQRAIRLATRSDVTDLRKNRRALLELCLIRSVRRAAVTGGSNPTWQRLPETPVHIEEGTLVDRFLESIEQIAASFLPVPKRPTADIIVGDSRQLPLPSSSVDFVLTSPPYCTRIDYVRKTWFELAATVPRSNADQIDLRRQMMGTTTIRPMDPLLKPQELPGDIACLLAEIRSHPSHGSAGYYFKNLMQYFQDALASIRELNRVLKPGAKAAILAQDSYYKEIRINLPYLYMSMARKYSFAATIEREFEVSHSFTQLNSRAKKHLPRHDYRESIVLLTRT